MKKYQFYFFLILTLLSFISCAGANSRTYSDIQASEAGGNLINKANTEYILQAGDIIDVKFFYNPELNERVTIRPDGKISLQLIDEVKAAGLAPSKLDEMLTERYSATIIRPEITVIVKEFAGQKVYVGGEVMGPRAVSLIGNMTALQAILNAGGFKETAYPGSVIIISKGPESLPVAREVDLAKVISGKSAENDVYLRPFDVIYVPKSPIANLNKFVDQYINKIIPSFVSAGFAYSVYKGKQTGTVETIPAK